MRLFLDTNVLVSAFATRGLCADLLGSVFAEHELLLGERLLEELRRALSRKLRIPRAIASEVEALLRSRAVAVASVADRRELAVSADDAWILTEALSARAEIFVTGDRELLAADLDVPFPRLSPRDAWLRLRA